MLHNDINLLKPALINRARMAIDQMNSDEILKRFGVERVQVCETLRELAVQMAYYSRSRMPVPDVQAMYSAAGLYSLTADEAKKPITWTLRSKHLEGNALDLVPVKNNVLWWNAPSEVWRRMGEIGKENHLIWGGDWKGKADTPHFEI